MSARVRLLRFPPPYRAAVTISNDLDDLLEPRGWWEFLRFLNTGEPTRFGEGLDLEIGDSFWFWSDHYDEQPGAWFQDLGDRAVALRALLRRPRPLRPSRHPP